jgi:phage terminase large subunit-like protein
MKIKFNSKYEPFFNMVHKKRAIRDTTRGIRYVILIGGRGSGKSYALAKWVNSATYCKYSVLFTRFTMTSAETSVIPEFRNMCETVGNDPDFTFKRTQVENHHTHATIDYKGLKPTSNNSTGALKSIANKNVFIVEEAEDCHNFELFDKVDNSIRMKGKHNIIVLCLNQGHKNHWIYQEFIKEQRDDTLVIESTYLDNLKHLDESFIAKAEKLKLSNLRRYNHVFLNEWQTDTDGAIWKQSDISAFRISKEDYEKDIKNQIIETVIAVDPAVTDSAMTEAERQDARAKGKEPDEDGIIVMGKTRNNHIYVIADLTCRGRRSDIAKVIVGAYNDYQANCVIVEKNNGGDWIKNALKSVSRSVKVENVTARKNKKIRAEPVQAVYEEGMVHHVDVFPELEYEMTTWVYDTGMDSPNHLDALVWGGTWLIQEEVAETSSQEY